MIIPIANTRLRRERILAPSLIKSFYSLKKHGMSFQEAMSGQASSMVVIKYLSWIYRIERFHKLLPKRFLIATSRLKRSDKKQRYLKIQLIKTEITLVWLIPICLALQAVNASVQCLLAKRAARTSGRSLRPASSYKLLIRGFLPRCAHNSAILS
jgi:hypothetical protein